MFYDWLLILIVLAVAVAHHDIARFEVGIVKQTWFFEFDSAAHLVVFKASGVFAAFAVAETLVVGFVVALLEGVLRTAAAHTAAVAFPLVVVAFEVAVSAEFSALVFPSVCLTLVALVVVATAAYGAFRAFEFLVADGATLLAELGIRAVENHVFAELAFQSAVEHGGISQKASSRFCRNIRVCIR